MPDLVKDFLKSWARHCLDLSTAQASARNELTKEAAALQQLQSIVESELSPPQKLREVALRLALAEYQVSYEHI